MKRTTLGLGIAALIAIGVLSTSAFALTVFGNNSQKGSLLIFPRVQAGGGEDTLITLTNDSSLPVLLKCYYATSDPLPTPYTGTAAGARSLKHFEDFTINVTHNQPIAWWASDGRAYSNSRSFSGFVAPPFGNPFPDGQIRAAGELKCWAITDDGATQKSHNHLYGTASLFVPASGQADEYTAWAFQAFAAPETATSSPGTLSLSNATGSSSPTLSFAITGVGSYTLNTGDITAATTLKTLPPVELVGGTTTPAAFVLAGLVTGAPVGFSTLTLHTTLGPDPFSISAGLLTLSFSSVVSAIIDPTVGTTHQGSISLQFAGTVTGDLSAGQTFLGQTITLSQTCTQTQTGAAVSCSESLQLLKSSADYDACPNILLGNFLASGTAAANTTRVTLASCNEDLRQAFTPTITKLTWTFFNQDEAARTGTHFCADSWFETTFPAAFWPFTTITGLGTEVGYFRIETTADKQVCGPDATTSAYIGVIEQSTGVGNRRGTNLTGRGPAFGVINYDPLHQ